MDKKLTYEQAMEELEKTVDKLENGDTSMDEAFELYEQGIKLSKFCQDYLKEKEEKIKSE